MVQSFLVKDEGKTLEFKDNCRSLRRIVQSVFDELPCPQINSEDIDFRAASEFFQGVSRRFTPAKRKSLGLTMDYEGRQRVKPALGSCWCEIQINIEIKALPEFQGGNHVCNRGYSSKFGAGKKV